ncbi:ABC transporter permease subunit [Acaryochloris sp. 'Moss Beach']|uniref:amino acid ABC transporter permease n=1 Tax=Acaryochloris TaxID=155977 RepID=UPI001BAF0DE1|nr:MULTISPECIES: ABC transporter permease subunit [Acaryochloris]QUY41061.1 ABC transporter permease subunit [Acaryochloris marina S15]UJB70231.1 ABC transporter permease subunit [Acaryochloris sp. 'Moss Beach']
MAKLRQGPRWRQPRVRDGMLQALVLLLIGLVIVYFGANLIQNLQRLRLPFGFDFLFTKSGPSIGETLIEYSPTDNIALAFGVALLNTLRVVVLGIFLATIIGIGVGIARLSDNWLVRKLATVYVETLRNFPLLLQLLFWYLAVFLKLPTFENRIQLPGPIILSKNGVAFPWLRANASTSTWLIALGIGSVLAFLLWRYLTRLQIEQGRIIFAWLWPLLLLMGLAGGIALFTQHLPFDLSQPQVDKLVVTGGLQFTSEFSALLLGLTLYTAAFIAEIVRAGIRSVSIGQSEAARALGLKPTLVMRFVVFPQALRVIVPPLTSQYLNLAKNSSLAVAVGYPDIYYVASASLEDTGRSVEIVLLLMAIYLTMSLLISILMNLYNRSIQLVER